MKEYKVGQVWRYKARKGEEASLLYIAKIDELPEWKIYHIYVDWIVIKSPLVEGGIQSYLPHSPVSRETLDSSVTVLARENANIPDITEGYKIWKEAFDAGNGGMFKIPVSEIVQYVDDVVNKRKPI